MSPVEQRALEHFIATVRDRYGARLRDVLLFGSRARGDSRPDSDFDIAIILDDGNWEPWREQASLTDLAFDALLEGELLIQPWPIARSAWEQPEQHSNPHFVRAVQRDARSLIEAT